MNLFIRSIESLKEAEVQLSNQWLLAKEVWSDPASEHFEKSFWSEIEAVTGASIRNLEELVATIQQAEREIADL
jgi:hypothetical protein